MSFFENIKTDGLEKEQDYVGGYEPFSTDVYEATIKAAWIDERDAGSKAVQVIADIDGREYTEALWFISKAGVNYYEYGGKKRPLPGFTIADDLCIVTTSKGLTDQAVEPKLLELYDYDANDKIMKEVPTLVGLTGKKVYLAIRESLENKNKQVNGQWVPTTETRTVNSIEKVMHSPTTKTVNEAKAGKNPTFMERWLKRHKGQVKDKRKIQDATSQASVSTPKSEHKSLFS